MSDVQELRFKVSATDEATAVINSITSNAANQARRLNEYMALQQQAAVAAAQGGGAGGGGALGELKGTFGRESPFTQAARMFAGGGAILGIGLATRELDQFATKLGDVKKMMDEGAGAGQIALGLAKSIPILGDVVSAFAQINELITGEQAAAELANQQFEQRNRYLQAQLALHKQIRDEERQAAREIAELANKTALVGVEGPARAYAESKNAAAAKKLEIQQKLEDEVKGFKNDKGVNEYVQALQKRKSEAESQAAGWQSNLNDPMLSQDAVNLSMQRLAESNQKAAALGAQIKAANDMVASQVADATKSAADQIAAIDKASAAERLQATKEELTAMRAAYNEADRQIAESRTKAQAMALRASGQFYAADELELKAALERENKAVDDALTKRVTGIESARKQGLLGNRTADEAKAEAFSQADAAKAANKADYDAAAAKAKIDAAKQQGDVQDRIASARMQSLDAEIAAGNKALEIERDRLRIAEQFNQRRQELNDLLAQAAPNQKAEIHAELAKLDAQERAVQAQRAFTSLRDLAHEAVARAAEGGDRRSKVALAQEDIKKQFSDQAKQLQALLKDPSLTASERQAAAALLAAQPGQEKAALFNAAKQGLGNVSPLAETSINQGGLHGVAQGALMAQYMRTQTDPHVIAQQKTNDILDKILEKLSEEPTDGGGGGDAGRIFAH
ncbi:MAG: hypothetical protein ABSH08_09660 [Tepidisphaeraceae bacterium]|jgi:hypothetical protein